MKRDFRPAAPVPPKTSLPLWRGILSLMRSDLKFYSEKSYRMKIGRFRLGRRTIYSVNEPACLRHILVDRQSNYPKDGTMQRLLGPLIGDSMFVSNGELWERQRRMVEPAFELSKLRQLFPLILGACDDLMERCERAADQGEVDIEAEMTHVTADAIFRTIFSTELDRGQAEALYDAFLDYQKQVPGFLLLEALRLGYWLAPMRYFRSRRAARRIRDLLEKLIAPRLDPGKRQADTSDILNTLIKARDPISGVAFDLRELIDEVAFFFLAGHETSASALTWTMYLIANDTDAQDRILTEVTKVCGDRALTFADINKLKFTRNVFREGLRLYPPVAFFTRNVEEKDQLRSHEVCPGDMVIVSPYIVQRHRDHWRDPDHFDPDRFDTEDGRKAMRQAYLPFNVGPRVCSGAAFALQEAVMILAMLVRRYRFLPYPGHEPELSSRLTLRPANGMKLKLERR